MTKVLLSPAFRDAQLAGDLEGRGVHVMRWPEGLVNYPEDLSALEEAIDNLFGYDWLILKNEIAADAFLRRVLLRYQSAELDQIRILSIGAEAEERIINSSIHVDLPEARFSISGVSSALESYAGGRNNLARLNFLVPSAGLMRDSFEIALEDAGARVDNVAAYRTTDDNRSLAQLSALLIGGGIDFIIFTSPQSLHDFARLVDTDNLAHVLAGIDVICFDWETQKTAVQFGLLETLVPSAATAASLAKVFTGADSQ